MILPFEFESWQHYMNCQFMKCNEGAPPESDNVKSLLWRVCDSFVCSFSEIKPIIAHTSFFGKFA